MSYLWTRCHQNYRDRNRICFLEKVHGEDIFVGGGVADVDYRGNVRVILTNLLDRAKERETGDRITQALS